MYLAHPTAFKSREAIDLGSALVKELCSVNPFVGFGFGRLSVGRDADWLHLARCSWTKLFRDFREGVMRELEDRLKWDKKKRIRVFMRMITAFHLITVARRIWKIVAEGGSARRKNKSESLADAPSSNQMIAFVGPSAVGKTIDWRLMQEHPVAPGEKYRRSSARDDNDEQYYNIISADRFLRA